jgi:uncharacterized protein YggE
MKNSKSAWLILFSLCLVATPGSAEPELKGTSADLAQLLTNVPRTVEVTGEAEVKIEADRAVLTVKVSTSARDLGAALRSNQQARGKFTELLAGKGIASGQVKASKFSSTEKYAVFSDKVKSHRVDNLLKVTVRNEKEFQIVADAIDSLPEAQYLGVDFDRSDKEEMKAKAIAQACDNATQRKRVFEEKLGLKLSVKGFRDPSGVPQGAIPTGLMGGARAVGFSGPTVTRDVGVVPDYTDALLTHALAQREGDGLGFGELTFRSRVTVEYSVEGK